jgi:hypothetical protein
LLLFGTTDEFLNSDKKGCPEEELPLFSRTLDFTSSASKFPCPRTMMESFLPKHHFSPDQKI